jgi:hypothetical protein
MTEPDQLEQLLQQMSLKAPSDELDRRVQTTLNSAAHTTPSVRAPIAAPWITHLLTAAAAMLIGITVGRVGSNTLSTGPATQSGLQQTTESTPADLQAADLPLVDVQPNRFRMHAETSAANRPIPASRTILGNESLVLLNGRHPVRSFESISSRTVKITDERTGEESQVEIPVRRIVLTESYGI